MLIQSGKKSNVFPLIRHFSALATPLLLRLRVTPNQITLASLAAGLVAAWCIAQGTTEDSVLGAVALLVSYILDNCDGEVARARDMRSTVGRHLDDLSDWLVHAAVFLAIGHATFEATDEELWWWFGVAAAVGATASYLAARIQDVRGTGHRDALHGPSADPALAQAPSGMKDRAIYIFRELFRADFCFIVLALAGVDGLWLLLPLGAIGSQVYWLAAFAKGARDYHV